MQKSLVSIVAALGKSRVLGKDNRLLWHIPEDLKRFHRLTLKHSVIMGRKTFDSIVSYLHEPLPDRMNIVITRDLNWKYPGVLATHSLEDALEKARALERGEIFIAGGAQIYTEALPSADRLYLTLVESDAEGDAYFPSYEALFTKKIFEEEHEWKGLKYRFIDIER